MIVRRTNALQYALLVGQGRSGTNYLLELLDQSPATHCRNEPDQLEGAALGRFRRARFFLDEPERDLLEREWDDAVAEAASSMGPRDHVVPGAKDWLYALGRRPGFFWLRMRYLLSHRFGGSGKPMDGREIRFPAWMAKRAELEGAFHVFKLNAASGLAEFVLARRPEARTLHIVRHPGGFAKSWWKRWVLGEGHQQRGAAGKDELQDADRLRALASRDPEWARLMGDVESMSALEAELWWWRYCNERVHELGRGSDAYRLVVFEELTAHPVEVARGVYEFCGIPYGREVETRVGALSRGSRGIAHAWREDLEPEARETVERVLDGSPMAGWWARAAG